MYLLPIDFIDVHYNNSASADYAPFPWKPLWVNHGFAIVFTQAEKGAWHNLNEINIISEHLFFLDKKATEQRSTVQRVWVFIVMFNRQARATNPWNGTT